MTPAQLIDAAADFAIYRAMQEARRALRFRKFDLRIGGFDATRDLSPAAIDRLVSAIDAEIGLLEMAYASDLQKAGIEIGEPMEAMNVANRSQG